MGDFNIIMNQALDKFIPENCKKQLQVGNLHDKQQLQNLCDMYKLEEIWRQRNPNTIRYSWFKSYDDPNTQASRIDLTFVSKGLDARVSNTSYLPGIMTDHAAMFCAVKLEKNSRGVGYWKLNTQLLNDERTLNELKQTAIEEFQKNRDTDPLVKWEQIKTSIQSKAKKLSRTKAAENTLVISQLMEKIDEFQSAFPLDKAQFDLYQKSLDDLNCRLDQEAQKVIFRSRVKWYEEGEKSTKYFFALEKSNYNAKTCTVIKDGNKTIEDDEQILEYQKSFFQTLYRKDPLVEFSPKCESPIKLSREESEALNVPFSQIELKNAVFGLKQGRTPGQDGLPIEIYRKCWDQINIPLMNMVNFAFENQMLHTTALQGVINVIPKPGKDSRLINNLRPITLLNCDYKIMEKMIMNRIAMVLEKLIHRDQRGFVPNRNIAVNIRKLMDIQSILEREEEEAIVLSLDFSKAFDKLSFSAIIGSLEFFNFPPYIIQWTKILYTDFEVRVQNNGKFSKYFKVTRGIHQGGVCSAAYFVLAAESMAQEIRRNDSIEGIRVRGTVSKLNQFADDTDTFSSFKQESVNSIMSVLKDVQSSTGLDVNYDKTTMYRIGSLRKSNAKLYTQPDIKWTSDRITVLGIKICNDQKDLISANYDPLVQSVTNTLRTWNNRSLSLMAKTLVVNSLIESLFIYKFRVLPNLPQVTLKKINNEIVHFMWNGKKTKDIARYSATAKETGWNRTHKLKKKGGCYKVYVVPDTQYRARS